MKERVKYIPAIVTLIAGLIASIITIICKYKIIDSMVTILVTMVMFYIVGLIIKGLFFSFLVVEEDKETDETTDEESETDESSVENPENKENNEEN